VAVPGWSLSDEVQLRIVLCQAAYGSALTARVPILQAVSKYRRNGRRRPLLRLLAPWRLSNRAAARMERKLQLLPRSCRLDFCRRMPYRMSCMNDSNDRLRQARGRAGFTSARSAALRFGWTPSTYASHENGQTPVPAGEAPKYARAVQSFDGVVCSPAKVRKSLATSSK